MTMTDLKTQIRHVPDFPKAGILFYDITTLLQDPAGLRAAIDSIAMPFKDQQIDLVVEHRNVSAKISTCERYRYRWYSNRDSLHGRCNSSGIQNVLAHILSVIDAAQHEVRTLGHQCFDGKHHAICGSSIELPASLASLDWPHRMMKCERMTRRTLLTIRCDHSHFPQWFRGGDKALETVREKSIIVRTQKPHQLSPAGRATGRGTGFENAPDLCDQSTPITRIASLTSRK
jgi:hypothetical protein